MQKTNFCVKIKKNIGFKGTWAIESITAMQKNSQLAIRIKILGLLLKNIMLICNYFSLSGLSLIISDKINYRNLYKVNKLNQKLKLKDAKAQQI